MRNINKDIRNSLLVNYAKKQINKKEQELLKNTSWIKARHLTNIIKEHCCILLEALMSEEYSFNTKESKLVLEKIIAYSFEKGSNLLTSKTDRELIRPLLQVNSYVIFEELKNGIHSRKPQKAVLFSIDKELNEIKEQVDTIEQAEEILNKKIAQAV